MELTGFDDDPCVKAWMDEKIMRMWRSDVDIFKRFYKEDRKIDSKEFNHIWGNIFSQSKRGESIRVNIFRRTNPELKLVIKYLDKIVKKIKKKQKKIKKNRKKN